MLYNIMSGSAPSTFGCKIFTPNLSLATLLVTTGFLFFALGSLKPQLRALAAHKSVRVQSAPCARFSLVPQTPSSLSRAS